MKLYTFIVNGNFSVKEKHGQQTQIRKSAFGRTQEKIIPHQEGVVGKQEKGNLK